MRAIDWLMEDLKRRGVAWIATLCGHGLDPLFDAARRAGMRLVDTRNEQTAAYMAECAGRLSRRPGVCAVSSGVAHVNALSGVANAWFDGAPMLLLSGAGSTATSGMGHFQDMDQVALTAPITRYSRVLDRPERVLQVLEEAWCQACGDPPGPVHITLPMDVQTAEVAESLLVRPFPAARTCLDAEETARAIVQALSEAQAPLVVAGSGVYYRRQSQDLLEFCERCWLPVVVPIWDRGCIDRRSPVYCGVVGAASGGPALLPESDCIIVSGMAGDYRLGFLQPGAVRADAKIFRFEGQWKTLDRVLAGSGGRSFRGWAQQAAARHAQFVQSVRDKAARQAAQGMHASHAVEAIDAVLTEETLLLIDGGSVGQWAHQLLDRYPGHWLTCGRSGVVGWGLGGAMAARLARPESPVILLSGDGAFTFNVAELECAVRQRLPFVAIVVDDLGWGITRTGHIRQFGEPISSSLGPVDFVGLARALGAAASRPGTPEALQVALREALTRPVVTVLHVPVVGGNP